MEADRSSHLDLAYLALQSEHWSEAAEEARRALAQAESAREDVEAALARFILGTALASPEDAAPGMREEARAHLAGALPGLERAGEPDLAGQAWALLGGLSLLAAREGRDGESLVEAGSCYRRAVEAFAGGDDPVGRCGALHNLGLCQAARSEEPGLDEADRAGLLDEALACFHDALELEVECGLSGLARDTEHERETAQAYRDA
ncbi:MAG TPA: hypothetical protein VMS93_10270, partial [Candidatus Saccharimonadales bacterium]|nr:hypothetical protein [Candidatus Saccharimonadales bacterium]